MLSIHNKQGSVNRLIIPTITTKVINNKHSVADANSIASSHIIYKIGGTNWENTIHTKQRHM